MEKIEREIIQADVVFIGAGPACLAGAIHLKNQIDDHNERADADSSVTRIEDPKIIVLEKGSDVGSHGISGAVLDPRALDELYPGWKEDESFPVERFVEREQMIVLSETSYFGLPIMPPELNDHGWLSEQKNEESKLSPLRLVMNFYMMNPIPLSVSALVIEALINMENQKMNLNLALMSWQRSQSLVKDPEDISLANYLRNMIFLTVKIPSPMKWAVKKSLSFQKALSKMASYISLLVIPLAAQWECSIQLLVERLSTQWAEIKLPLVY